MPVGYQMMVTGTKRPIAPDIDLSQLHEQLAVLTRCPRAEIVEDEIGSLPREDLHAVAKIVHDSVAIALDQHAIFVSASADSADMQPVIGAILTEQRHGWPEPIMLPAADKIRREQ